MTDPRAIADFRGRVGTEVFEADLIRLASSPGREWRPDVGIFRPVEAPELEAWAELPGWARLTGVPGGGEDLVTRVFRAACGGPAGRFRLRATNHSVANAPEAGALSVDLLAPLEERSGFTLADRANREVVFVGFADLRRLHAKTLKHVYALGRGTAWARARRVPLVPQVIPEREAGPTPERVGWVRTGCNVVNADDGQLDEDFFRAYCERCPTSVLLAVDPSVRGACRSLQSATMATFGNGEAEGTVAYFSRGMRGADIGLGIADRRGMVLITKRAGVQSGSEVHVATTTYLKATPGRPNAGQSERYRLAVAGLEDDVSRSPGATFIHKRSP